MAKQEENNLFALTSFLYGGNADYIEALYAAYEQNPEAVAPEWREFFAGLHDDKNDVLKNAEGASWQRPAWPLKANGELIAALDGNWAATTPELPAKGKDKNAGKIAAAPANAAASVPTMGQLQQAAQDSARVLALIHAYQAYGHLRAQLDPLQFAKRPEDYHLLSPEHYGFTAADYDRPIFVDGALGLQTATIRQLLEILPRLYCSTIGAEFMHITDPERRAWIEQKFSLAARQQAVSTEDKKRALQKLVEAEGFEKFLDTKYKGTKRFGLDGGEALIPALDKLICRGADLGVSGFVFGMAHRGRLNVLTQILAKAHRAVFHEFKGGSYKPEDIAGSGDVKYHLGAAHDGEAGGRPVHLSLLPNPSHLEIVDPIVLGKARAQQDIMAGPGRDDNVPLAERDKIMSVLIHGDAAFAGQGVVAETFSLSRLKGYTVGGSVHFIINNQIGFTTDPSCARSSTYCSDLAKMIEAPVFHVNGDDTEAMLYIAALAAEYRHKFHQPIIIDMVCYRRFGHNEGDEPAFTQPLMYQNIRSHKGVLELYGARLATEGVVKPEETAAAQKAFHDKMETEFATDYLPNKAEWLEGLWANMRVSDNSEEQSHVETGVAAAKLRAIGTKLTEIPAGFHLHRTVQRFIDNRKKMLATGAGLDWAMAEALAFGSLVLAGNPIRLSGEDVERGTFSQRHSVFYDQETGAPYIPLNHLADNQALYEPVNSLLSEEAVLAYEYGYSLVNPQGLTLWEAQFGDFANGAQTVFDQFIAASEQKWLRMSGLICLLPHGFEGQGPEHSSARLERFLQLCAEDNMQVANCTTPANYFHILRRQIERNFRKPLIIMTPKSLLRHKRAVSSLADIDEGTYFRPVLADDAEIPANQPVKLQKDEKIRRIILCSGKVYYDLYEERERRAIDDIYIIRLEQLYPFPAQALAGLLRRFKQAEIVWCQEEPKNMGAWSFIVPYVEWVLQHIEAQAVRPCYVGRPAAASPAAGLLRDHQKQLAAFLAEAFGEQNFED
ncbi:2-oxoglutarate dehydrogenase E1 component [Candidatus Tokpelaia sp.]|uniref:2-oxoglutarate dehydrogenase E1 component n=1 Tax=Candidatus Tokpelaia sp. TaxID=2233777 RepID=UPI001238CB8E|nr:2-oxoglutarate dehydrogenase E1 component [Candidatus Tokpelaia sp.]KAA6406180.1 2-oxoglutarate dehydrogenase E1 component [Candidatus Tokpelaia sp.]